MVSRQKTRKRMEWNSPFHWILGFSNHLFVQPFSTIWESRQIISINRSMAWWKPENEMITSACHTLEQECIQWLYESNNPWWYLYNKNNMNNAIIHWNIIHWNMVHVCVRQLNKWVHVRRLHEVDMKSVSCQWDQLHLLQPLGHALCSTLSAWLQAQERCFLWRYRILVHT